MSQVPTDDGALVELRRSAREGDPAAARVSRADVRANGTQAAVFRTSSRYNCSSRAALKRGAFDGSVLSLATTSFTTTPAPACCCDAVQPGVSGRLVSNPDLPIPIRPSLDLRWLGERRADHHEVWELALAIAVSPEIPEIATPTGTTVVATGTANIDDLAAFLLSRIDTPVDGRPGT